MCIIYTCIYRRLTVKATSFDKGLCIRMSYSNYVLDILPWEFNINVCNSLDMCVSDLETFTR